MKSLIVARAISLLIVSLVLAAGALFLEDDERLLTEGMTHQELIEYVSAYNATGFFEAFGILLVFGLFYIGTVEFLALGLRWLWNGFWENGFE